MTEDRDSERESSNRSSNRGSGGRRRFRRRARVCQFCADKSIVVDYKQVDLLKRYVNEQGKIRTRRDTGNCAKHQRIIAKNVKRARHMAFLSFVGDQRR